jgi:hypothetical protein
VNEAERAPAADPLESALAPRFRYEHTLRSLERQSSVLAELRTRASIVLSATGIVASLIGPRALAEKTPLGLAIAALVMLTAGLLACIAVLWPASDRGKLADPDLPRWRWQRRHRHWKLNLTARELMQVTARPTESEILDGMVDLLTPARRVNYRTLERRSWMFNSACILLVAQLGIWTSILLYNGR